jgi:uncharacterized membrane protein YadS
VVAKVRPQALAQGSVQRVHGQLLQGLQVVGVNITQVAQLGVKGMQHAAIGQLVAMLLVLWVRHVRPVLWVLRTVVAGASGGCGCGSSRARLLFQHRDDVFVLGGAATGLSRA